MNQETEGPDSPLRKSGPDCSWSKSTLSSYGSALNSYLNFIRMHDFPVEPTAETLSFFTVYMCHYINPHPVNTYLSGIAQQLEADFPNTKEAQNSALVHHTLQGCMRMKGRATVRNCALTTNDLHLVVNHYKNSTLHDDLLFVSMLQMGFFGLLRLGEMTFLDDTSLQNVTIFLILLCLPMTFHYF